MAQLQLPKCILKDDGDLKVAIPNTIYDFFAPRTKDIVVRCYGFRKGGFEASLCESTGAKVQVFDARPEAKESYDIYSRIMETHEALPADPKWSEALTNMWILPDSSTFSAELPWNYSGSIMVDGVRTPLVTKPVERVDICKIDYGTFTDEIVFQLLRSPYRPGLLFVCWPIGPDDSNESAACAGHLQTMGYRLLAAAGSFYTYIYVDQCMYEICSWARTDCNNPMFEEYRAQIFNAFNPVAGTTGPSPVEPVEPVPSS